MLLSVRALLTGIIDFAGMFPPASLPLHDAFHQYAKYRQEPEFWMLGRFICPAARLAELSALPMERFPPGPPVPFSALGRGGKTVPEFLTGLHEDLADIARFRDGRKTRVEVDVLEVRLPCDLLKSPLPVTVEHPFVTAARCIQEVGPPALSVYFEPSNVLEGRKTLGDLFDALAHYNQFFAKSFPRTGKIGFKLRSGGLQASDFPSTDEVAFVISACRDAEVPLKFTAGLHHPDRHFDAALQMKMHGFLNLFAAGVFAWARKLNESMLLRIIEDENPEHFIFASDTLQWNDWQVTASDIAAARRQSVISFGSCSFDEPRDDLRSLGLI